MLESFEKLVDILPDWTNKGVEKRLAEDVDKFKNNKEK